MTRILLLVNLLALGLGLGLSHLVAHRPPNLPALNADKIRLLSQPEAYRPRPAAVAPPVAGTASVCLELPGLDQQRFVEIGEVLRAAGFAAPQCSLTLGRKLGWWVFWPPEYEAGQRERAMQAMRAAGLEDILPIREGSMAQAYSLGVFTFESQARQLRDRLRGKGLDKVDYGPRPSTVAARLECRAVAVEPIQRLQASLPAWAQWLDAGQCAANGGQ